MISVAGRLPYSPFMHFSVCSSWGPERADVTSVSVLKAVLPVGVSSEPKQEWLRQFSGWCLTSYLPQSDVQLLPLTLGKGPAAFAK